MRHRQLEVALILEWLALGVALVVTEHEDERPVVSSSWSVWLGWGWPPWYSMARRWVRS